MSDERVIRDASLDDLARIVELIHDGRVEGSISVEAPADQPAAGYIAAFHAIVAHPGARLLVVEASGTVIGTFQFALIPNFSHQGRPVAQVESVHVARVERGRGTGELMMRWAIDEARKAGCFRLQLTSSTARTDAHRFYARLGFVNSHVGMKLNL